MHVVEIRRNADFDRTPRVEVLSYEEARAHDLPRRGLGVPHLASERSHADTLSGEVHESREFGGRKEHARTVRGAREEILFEVDLLLFGKRGEFVRVTQEVERARHAPEEVPGPYLVFRPRAHPQG